jgi:hypothetical protein
MQMPPVRAAKPPHTRQLGENALSYDRPVGAPPEADLPHEEWKTVAAREIPEAGASFRLPWLRN